MKKLGKREKVKVLRRTHWLRRKLEFFLFVLLKFVKGVRCNEYESLVDMIGRKLLLKQNASFIRLVDNSIMVVGMGVMVGVGDHWRSLTYFH